MQSSGSGLAWSPHNGYAAGRQISHLIAMWAPPEQAVKVESSDSGQLALHVAAQIVRHLVNLKTHAISQPVEEEMFVGAGKV